MEGGRGREMSIILIPPQPLPLIKMAGESSHEEQTAEVENFIRGPAAEAKESVTLAQRDHGGLRAEKEKTTHSIQIESCPWPNYSCLPHELVTPLAAATRMGSEACILGLSVKSKRYSSWSFPRRVKRSISYSTL